MAAARGSGRASVLWLLLLLLVPLLWVPAGVRAVPDEDLSHRNKGPPAPALKLQPQSEAAKVPEPARAEVSRTGQGGRRCGAGCTGYQARGRPESLPRPRAAGWGRGARPDSWGWKTVEGAFSGVRPGVSSLLMWEERRIQAWRPQFGSIKMGVLLIRCIL